MAKVYKNAKDWTCPYCNLIVKSRKNFYAHLKECDEKAKLPKDSLGRIIVPSQQDGIRAYAASLKGKSQEGHKHTEEAKKKISEGRLKALREGRGNHWICPLIKRSYAEQYFYDAFTNAKIEFQNNVWLCHRYCVDFLFGNYYFEVDGEQHYTAEAIEHDKERETFLLEHGYKCLKRCRWKEFRKLSFEDKADYINGLVAQLAEATHSKCVQCEFESHSDY